MATIERFEDIEAWQSARKLRQAVYLLTRAKPFASDFALVDQIRRAAISGGSNIAEGFERAEIVNSFSSCPTPRARLASTSVNLESAATSLTADPTA